MPIEIQGAAAESVIGHCEYAEHDARPLHDDRAGWTICWECWEQQPHFTCTDCHFIGVQEQLLELSSGAPLCHPCHDKLSRTPQAPEQRRTP